MLYDTKDPSLQIISARLVEKLFGEDFVSGFLKTPSLLRENANTPNTSKIVRRIRAAVDNRKVIKFRYLKPGATSKPKLRKVNPWRFSLEDILHIIWICILSGKTKFRYFRIKQNPELLMMTRETFKSTDFDLDSFGASI
ncbi:MAG: WYL domain-containing protein [Caldisericia bacterium]